MFNKFYYIAKHEMGAIHPHQIVHFQLNWPSSHSACMATILMPLDKYTKKRFSSDFDSWRISKSVYALLFRQFWGKSPLWTLSLWYAPSGLPYRNPETSLLIVKLCKLLITKRSAIEENYLTRTTRSVLSRKVVVVVRSCSRDEAYFSNL